MNRYQIYQEIAQIAQACLSQGVLMSFDDLAVILTQRFKQKFSAGRGMARRVRAAYYYSSRTSKLHDCIAKVFVKKNGQYAY